MSAQLQVTAAHVGPRLKKHSPPASVHSCPGDFSGLLVASISPASGHSCPHGSSCNTGQKHVPSLIGAACCSSLLIQRRREKTGSIVGLPPVHKRPSGTGLSPAATQLQATAAHVGPYSTMKHVSSASGPSCPSEMTSMNEFYFQHCCHLVPCQNRVECGIPEHWKEACLSSIDVTCCSSFQNTGNKHCPPPPSPPSPSFRS